ncbi:four helix bundle protein [Luteolibacter marinus]|uniref:four helix bundle protein n=1 Tax=Luteolibacter marinus TaxID=2776705 RepID=UPI001865F311|nr:four helix bundle protein [Luteolibacter marinus]
MSSSPPPTARFDHEKLDVYQLELAFVAWVTPILSGLKNSAPGFHREVCNQLDRASLSALLNTDEGNGKRPGKQRARFFDDARGSAVECAACLDGLVAKQLVIQAEATEGKVMLVRIVGMLCKLVDRFDQSTDRLREDEFASSPADCRPSSLCSVEPHIDEQHIGGQPFEDEGRERGRSR